MRILRKLAAALTVVLAISTLSACKENENAPAQGTAPQSTTSESKPAPQSSAPQNTPESSSEPEQSVPTTTSAPTATSLHEGFPENPSEASLKYYEDATGIVDKYLSTVMGNNDEIEQLGFDDLDYENPEDIKKVVQYLIDCANWGEGYLDELEKLTPTEEMSAFHGELVSLMNILRGYTDIARSLENVDIYDDAASDKYNERLYRIFERFNRECRAFYVKYPGFGRTLAEGEWQKNGSMASYYVVLDIGGEAEKSAKSVSYAITYGLSVQEDKPPLENAVIDIIRTKNGCEITGAALSDENIKGIEYYLNIFFPEDYEFWARVWLREDGSPRCTLYSSDGKLDDSELNGGKGLSENLREWRGTGVTSGGHIIGIFGAPPTDEDSASGYDSRGTDADDFTSENVIMGTSPKPANRPAG